MVEQRRIVERHSLNKEEDGTSPFHDHLKEMRLFRHSHAAFRKEPVAEPETGGEDDVSKNGAGLGTAATTRTKMPSHTIAIGLEAMKNPEKQRDVNMTAEPVQHSGRKSKRHGVPGCELPRHRTPL